MPISRPHWLDWQTYSEFVQSREPACAHCNAVDTLLSIDHIVPRHWGGDDSLTNLQWLCIPCNSKKSDRPDGYWNREFFFDRRPDLTDARVAQQRIFNLILAEDGLFGRPFSQLNRVLY